MYKFTIEYYFERYHTGALNPNKTREAVVLANNRAEAIKKIKAVDDCYLGVANARFEEMVGDRDV